MQHSYTRRKRKIYSAGTESVISIYQSIKNKKKKTKGEINVIFILCYFGWVWLIFSLLAHVHLKPISSFLLDD